jgi:hypothetical protein
MIPQKMHVSQLVDSLCVVLNHPLILGIIRSCFVFVILLDFSFLLVDAFNSVKEHVPQNTMAGLLGTRAFDSLSSCPDC